MAKLRVAVIGAGAAGLCAARHLAAKPDLFQPVVYEQTGRVGGTWVYVEETGTDRHGLPIHASMYQNLKTNLPKEVMAFPDFPFKEDGPSFISHTEVLQYLVDYASHFKLQQYIKFWTCVESVTPVTTCDSEREQWVVTVRDLEKNLQETNTFDAVMVCNGHYAVPHTPEIIGLDSFHGHYIHSHNYRCPDPYKGKTVAVIGAGASGIDIALDVATVARKVLLCHWNPRLVSVLPSNVEQTNAVSSIENGNTVILDDEAEYSVDAIIACTGYEYSFPFLKPECHLTITDRHIEQLYMHLIHMVHPTMSFVGITYRICPFPLFMHQVKFVLGILEGSVILPSREEIEAEEKGSLETMIKNGDHRRFYHTLGSKQWQYNDLLARKCGLEKLPSVIKELYDYVAVYRNKEVTTYKKMNFRLIGDHFEQKEDTV